jgi:anthranilate synthase component I
MSLTMSRDRFVELARAAAAPGVTLAIPLGLRLMGDQLTPVLAYRRLVVADERTAPSFLFESVEGGDRVGRYSLMGSRPIIEVIARQHDVTIRDRRRSASRPVTRTTESDPLLVPRALTASIKQLDPPADLARLLPGSTRGGWVGFASYDTVRYAEPDALPWSSAPRDDRALPDLHFAFYPRVVVFDHAQTLVHAVELVLIEPGDDPASAYDRARDDLNHISAALQTHSKPLPSGVVRPAHQPPTPGDSNLTPQQHAAIVERAKEYIRAGDIFQVVLGQRFERRSAADPFDVYRALRAVNPSPYMGYLQSEGCILVASSPEILCRVQRAESSTQNKRAESSAPLQVTNRPLAGTRRRGMTHAEDIALEHELLADQKERAEHIMLVDLGRNDVGRVAVPGTVDLPALMHVERYSHVMHISSTVTGHLAPQFDCWDALRAALPVGTISGAPKVRAMQIIDELEPLRRGPYGGGFGHVSLAGEMDIALALRTIVVPTAAHDGSTWLYHLQASGGIVFDSTPAAEYAETVNKAAALARAIDVAEQAFA